MRRSTTESPLNVDAFGGCPQPSKALMLKTSSMRLVATPAIVVILGLAIFFVYLPGIGIPYFGDDFGWVDVSTAPLRHFVQVNADGWYRPIQASIYTVVQKNFGLNTVPIHLLNFLAHALLCWLIANSVTALGYAPATAFLAAFFMALSQANAFALLSNDTFSQVAGTFFGCLSLWGLLKWNRDPAAYAKPIVPYIVSVVAFALALLSKETTSSFFPILGCALLFQNYRAANKFASIKKVFLELIPFALVFLAYFIIRLLVGANSPSFGSGGYNFRIGLNVPINLLMDLFAAAVPASTVTAFEAFHAHDVATIALIASSTALSLLAVGYGLWLRRSDLKIAAGIIFLIGSAFPMVLMNHVSELYVYNLMPFFSILVGIGVSALLDASKRVYIRQAIAAGFVLMLLSHIGAIRDKAALMQKNGERAAMLLQQIGPYVNEVPPGGELLLVNPSTGQTEYAVYLMPGFKALEFGESFIKKTYAREDISLRIVDEAEFKALKQRADAMILTVNGDTLEVISKPSANYNGPGGQNGARYG